MSRSGCWKCGGGSHERFECEQPVTDEESKQVKKNSKIDELMAAPRDSAKTIRKWMERVQIKEGPPLERCFLKKEVHRYLNMILDLKDTILEIGPPCLCCNQCPTTGNNNLGHVNEQLDKLNEIKLTKNIQWPSIRALIASVKCYLKSVKGKERLDEDELLKTYMDDLDNERPGFHNLIEKRLIEYKDAIKYKQQLKNDYKDMVQNLKKQREVLALRPLTHEKLDLVLLSLASFQLGFDHLDKKYNFLVSICEPASLHWIFLHINSLKDQIGQLKSSASEKRQQLIQDGLLDTGGICKICEDGTVNLAFTCGHALCNACFQGILNAEEMPRCPFCRGNVEPCVPLHL